ncbi:ATP-binding response regulator [Pseudomonas sp. LRF_L74]|uniref:ATP-binding response regulator n=1 Tax=Pseudomonas sp. LRF_L74 TaxID=3369422 RepID=UPI003F6119D2
MTVDTEKVYDPERGQAWVRLLVSGTAMIYVLAVFFSANATEETTRLILYFIPVFMIVSLLLLGDVIQRPGVKPARRLFAMLLDYFSITLSMYLGGEAMLPVYGAVLWVTVGNGVRYGSFYLAIATAMALLSLLILYQFSPYLHEEPYLLATLLITTLVVPAYVNSLLAQSRRANEAERAANQAKSQFLAQASHDLRQPIHSIGLFTACLRDADLAPAQRQMVDSIDKSLHSVAQLFRSILDMYTLDGGRVTPRAEVVCLSELLTSVAQQNSEAARWAGVSIRVRAPRQHVLVDPGLLTTMVQNLLSNALKYASGRPVLIGCRRRAGTFAIEVYDRGRGIEPQHIANVFDEFYRVRQVRDNDIEGVGLGLAIVRRLARLMGLEVRMRSQVGKGTTVAIEGLLPVRPTAEERSVSSRQASGSPRMLDGLRVCLIEDDRSVLLATATLLRKWGCLVQTSLSIPQGDGGDFDLVITDFDLGREASGADCIQYLRELSGQRIPAIVVTGHEVKRVQEAVDDPDIPVLSKPLHPAELRSTLVALKAGLLPGR